MGKAALEVFGQDFPGKIGDTPLIGKGQFAGQFLEGNPGGIDGLLIGIVLDGQLSTGRPQEEMVDGFVDPVPAHGEPGVPGAMRGLERVFPDWGDWVVLAADIVIIVP